MWMKQYPGKDFRQYHFESGLEKKLPEGQESCEEGNMKCNMENVLKGHIIYSNQIDIWKGGHIKEPLKETQ